MDSILCWDKSELWAIWLKHGNPLDWNHLKAANGWADSGCRLPYKTPPYVSLLLPEDQQTEIKFTLRRSLRKNQIFSKLTEFFASPVLPRHVHTLLPQTRQHPNVAYILVLHLWLVIKAKRPIYSNSYRPSLKNACIGAAVRPHLKWVKLGQKCWLKVYLQI